MIAAGSDHCTTSRSSLREIGSSIAAAGVATFHVVGENYDVRPAARSDLPAVPLFRGGFRVPGSVVGIVERPGNPGLVRYMGLKLDDMTRS